MEYMNIGIYEYMEYIGIYGIYEYRNIGIYGIYEYRNIWIHEYMNTRNIFSFYGLWFIYVVYSLMVYGLFILLFISDI